MIAFYKYGNGDKARNSSNLWRRSRKISIKLHTVWPIHNLLFENESSRRKNRSLASFTGGFPLWIKLNQLRQFYWNNKTKWITYKFTAISQRLNMSRELKTRTWLRQRKVKIFEKFSTHQRVVILKNILFLN